MSAADLLTLGFWLGGLPAAAGVLTRWLAAARSAAAAVALCCAAAAVCGSAAADVGWTWPPARPLGVLSWAILALAGIGAARGSARWTYLGVWLVAAHLTLLWPLLPPDRAADVLFAAALPALALSGVVVSEGASRGGAADLVSAVVVAAAAGALAGFAASVRLAQLALPLAVVLGVMAAAGGAEARARCGPAAYAAAAGTGAAVVLAARMYADLAAWPAWIYAAALALPPLLGRGGRAGWRLCSLVLLLAAAVGLAARNHLAAPA